MRRVRRSTTPQLRLDLAPLIDVVFLLLTFFVFAMALMVRADVLDVRLPEVGSGRTGQRSAAITIAIDIDGGVFIDAEPIAVGLVAERVVALRREMGEGTPLLIAVDEGGRAGRLIEVADALAGAGLSEFSVIGQAGEGKAGPP